MTFHLALYFTSLSLLCHSQGSHKSLRNERFWRLTWTNNRPDCQYPWSWTNLVKIIIVLTELCVLHTQSQCCTECTKFPGSYMHCYLLLLMWPFELFVSRHLNSTTFNPSLKLLLPITKSWTEDTAEEPDSRMSISSMIFQVALVWRVSSQPGFFIGILLPLILPSLILPLLAILHSLTQVSVDVKFEHMWENSFFNILLLT